LRLTEGRASLPRMSESQPRKRAVRPRDAASLIVLRHGRGAPEVLLGMRAAGHRFMPNRLAFPGGAVDRADFSAQPATALAAALRESHGPGA
jgi:8-oxo-dGTP pyrophosphatase MutT (NUDIX family)